MGCSKISKIMKFELFFIELLKKYFGRFFLLTLYVSKILNLTLFNAALSHVNIRYSHWPCTASLISFTKNNNKNNSIKMQNVYNINLHKNLYFFILARASEWSTQSKLPLFSSFISLSLFFLLLPAFYFSTRRVGARALKFGM